MNKGVQGYGTYSETGEFTLTGRQCKTCRRTKGRHLWLLRQWNQKSPSDCKKCYKKSDGYRLSLDANYQEKYGITLEEYELLLAEQAGRCAICKKEPGRVRLAVDHDHALERIVGVRRSVRGLLCRACNEYLAHIRDDGRAAAAMEVYLMYGGEETDRILNPEEL